MIPALFIGFLSGAIIGVIIVAASKGDGKTVDPFGPFLAAGAVVALFAGAPLISAYLSLARALSLRGRRCSLVATAPAASINVIREPPTSSSPAAARPS